MCRLVFTGDSVKMMRASGETISILMFRFVGSAVSLSNEYLSPNTKALRLRLIIAKYNACDANDQTEVSVSFLCGNCVQCDYAVGTHRCVITLCTNWMLSWKSQFSNLVLCVTFGDYKLFQLKNNRQYFFVKTQLDWNSFGNMGKPKLTNW